MTQARVLVNGTATTLDPAAVHTTALDWLRERGLTGAKEGCAEGECGACSVLVARPGTATTTEWVAVNACLVPAGTLDGQEVVTAEGLGTPADLHPVQREMAVRGGSQCGYCTPGFVCSMAAEYYRPDRTAAPSAGHGDNGFDLHALSGNLCRCTGYRPIRDAAHALGAPGQDDPLAARAHRPAPVPVATTLRRHGCELVRPGSLAEALALLASRPGATVVAGSTDTGVEVNLRGARPELVVVIDRLDELRTLVTTAEHVEIGAGLTLTEVERGLAGRVPLLAEMLPQFASRLIRNAATLGGNLGTGSPVGDAAPALLALEATLVLTGVDGEREVALAEYFTGYRASVRQPGELIRAVRVPLPLAPVTAFQKVAKRRFDDISGVAVAVALHLDAATATVLRARIGLGGVAATPLRARDTEAALVGRPFTAGTVRAAAEVLRDEGTPLDDHRASAAYRRQVLAGALPRLLAAHRPGPDPQEVRA